MYFNGVLCLVCNTCIFRGYFKLIALAVTCTHSSLPRARIENVLFPDAVGSGFPGRDVFSDLERCEHLFLGESVESFRRI